MKKPQQSVGVKVLKKKSENKRNVWPYTCSQNEENPMHGVEPKREDEHWPQFKY